MAAAAPAPPVLSPEPATLDHDDSNISSPLSDVEDKDGDGSLDGMNIEHEVTHEEASDSDSNLSEANDTEAETERLYDTPQAQRHRDVVVSQFNGDQVLERTPSKLQKKSAVADEADNDDDDDDSLSDDDISLASSHEGEEHSPSKPAKSTEPSSVEDSKEISEGKKRKRSPVAEQSESEQPLRKRTGSVAAPDHDQHDDDTIMADDEALSTNPHSGNQSAIEDNGGGSVVAKREPSRSDEFPSKESTIAKKVTRNGSKRKSPTIESGDHDEHGEETHEEGTADEDAEVAGEEEHADVDAEDDAEGAAKNDEELERKRAALEEWSELEEKFGVFRERLYKDRLERLELEELSLNAEPPSHPEYLNMKQCLDDRLDTKLKHINKEYEIAIEAHERLAVARKAAIWGQFYQAVREKREQMLEALNKEWYETQNARRTAHSVPDFGILFPQNPAQRTRNAVAYNTEVSYLAGLAKHEGFPAVPLMRGASNAEIEDDLEAIKRAKPRQHSIMQPLEDYQAVSFGGSLGPAGEQFIKNTPWANPRHISHKLQRTPSQPEARTHSPLSSAKPHHGSAISSGTSAALSNGNQPGSQKSPPNRFASASPEMIRSANILSHANQMKRVPSITGGRASKAAQETATKHDAPVAMAS